MIPRRRGEGPGTYVKRVLLAQSEVSTADLASDIPPAEVERIIARLRQKDWRIDAVASDQHGWRTYHLRGIPKKKDKREDYTEKPPPGRWACVTCGDPPVDVPIRLLGGMGRGRCARCDTKTLFTER